MNVDPRDLIMQDILAGNLVARIRALEDMVAALATREVQADSIDEIAVDLGEYRSARLMAITAADPSDVEANGAFFDSEGILFSDGKVYHYGGLHEGKLTTGTRAEDGAHIWADGDGVQDQNGQFMYGVRFALEHLATDPNGNNPRRGRIEMIYPDGGTIPAWRLQFADASPSTELITNGNFETGDTTGWTATLTGDAAFAAVDDGAGGFQGSLNAGSGTASVLTTQAAVEAGKNYASRVTYEAGRIASVWVTIRLDWINSVGAVVSSQTLVSKSITGGGPGLQYVRIQRTTYSGTVKAPAGAVGARLYLSSNGAMLYDDVSLQVVQISDEILFDDNGLSILKWGAVANGGTDQDNVTSESYTDISCPVRVLADAIKIYVLYWDIRTSGTHDLRLTWDDNRANNQKTIWSGSAPGSSEVTIVLGEPLVLTRGLHYLTLVRTGGSGVMYGKTSSPINVNGDLRIERASFDGTASSTRVAPVKFDYRKGKFS